MKEVDPILVDVTKLLGYTVGESFEFPMEVNQIYKFNVDLVITKIDLLRKIITLNSIIDKE